MNRDLVGAEVTAALGLLVRRETRERIYAELTRDVADGVTELTYPVISGLERRGPCNAAELAAVVGLDRSVVSRRASVLEGAGLLTRTSDPRDSRWTLLSLTEKGREVVAMMRGRLRDILSDWLDQWPENEVNAFVRILSDFTVSGPFAHNNAEALPAI